MRKLYKILAPILSLFLLSPIAIAQSATTVTSLDTSIDDVVIKNKDLAGKINFLPIIRNKNIKIKLGLGACWDDGPYEISVYDKVANTTTVASGNAPKLSDCGDWFNSKTAAPAEYAIMRTKDFTGQSVFFTYSGPAPYSQQLEVRVYEDKERSSSSSEINNRYIGRVMMRTESNGQLYYISPRSKKAYYIVVPNHTKQIIIGTGVGITNSDIAKIPVGGACPATIPNCDSPAKYDQNFANKYKGYIFLQIEEKGESWYVNPADSKRYYLNSPQSAYNLLAATAVGISEKDFTKLELAY